jgi:HD-like signal output (HDOD) protein
LGRNEVEALLIAASVRGALQRRPRPGFAPNRFWKASARRAAVARAVAGALHPETKSEAFTAALLQDMAVPLLADALRRSYGAVLVESYAQGYDLAQLELNEFGWTHADAAGWMCKQWSFPKRITLGIERHHYTDLNAVGVLPAVSLVSLLREKDGQDTGNDELIEAVASYAGMPTDVTQELVQTAVDSADDVARMFVGR